MMVLFRAKHIFVLFSFLLLPGCGKSLDSTISGTVTLAGTPLALGTITFHPVAGGAAAYGVIDAGGNYSIQTGTKQGIEPGEYIATVVAAEPPANPETPGKLLTPEKYGRKETSPLKYTIEPGPNTIPVNLEP